MASSGPITAAELAEITKADKLLIGKHRQTILCILSLLWQFTFTCLILLVRIMRPLTYMKVFDEVGVETYTWTPISHFLTMPSVAGGYKFMFVLPTL